MIYCYMIHATENEMNYLKYIYFYSFEIHITF